MQAMGSDRLRALLRDLADDDRRLLECRIVDGWHLRRYRRAPRGAARCFGGPGASAGAGAAFTDASCYLLNDLPADSRERLLRELLHPSELALNVFRIWVQRLCHQGLQL